MILIESPSRVNYETLLTAIFQAIKKAGITSFVFDSDNNLVDVETKDKLAKNESSSTYITISGKRVLFTKYVWELAGDSSANINKILLFNTINLGFPRSMVKKI